MRLESKEHFLEEQLLPQWSWKAATLLCHEAQFYLGWFTKMEKHLKKICLGTISLDE